MAHCMKHTKASCGHMFAHFDRKAEHISNENVDRTRSHLNYNLAAHQQMEQGEFVRQRCSEVRCQNRKDVNVMVSWIVTAPKDLPQQAEPAFFQAAYDFLENRYGRSNVVSAYVHMDEVTPHMHFAFVPVTQDRKRGGYKVSAKEVITRRDLQTFHSDLSKYLEQQLGFPVNVLNEATKEGNRSIEQLKRQSATEQIAAAAAEAAQIVSDAQEKVTALNDSLIAVRAEYDAKTAYVRKADEISDISTMYPAQAKVTEKGLFHKEKFVTVPAEMWENKHISANEKEYLKKATAKFEESMSEFRYTASAENLADLKSQIRSLQQEKTNLRMENRDLRDKLKKRKDAYGTAINNIQRVLDRIDESSASKFVDEWNRQHPVRRRDDPER
mgnify:FL=1|jgi:regulator of replication initiation timing